jgi:hypothetical protein
MVDGSAECGVRSAVAKWKIANGSEKAVLCSLFFKLYL